MKINKPQTKNFVDEKSMKKEKQVNQQKKFKEFQDKTRQQQQKSLFDKSVNNHAKQNDELKKDIAEYQKELKNNTKKDSKISRPDNTQLDLIDKYSYSKKETKNKKIQEQEQLFQKGKIDKQKKEIHRTKVNRRGSDKTIRKYETDKTAEKMDKMVNSNILNVYTERFVHWISGGWNKQNILDKNIPLDTFYNSTNKIYTQNSVKMPIFIYSYPSYLEIGWLEEIREGLESIKNKYNQENNTQLQVSLNRIVSGNMSHFNFSQNKRFIRDYDNLEKQYYENQQLLGNENIKERDKKRVLGEDNFLKLQTYEWLREVENDDIDSLWETREFLELVVSQGNSSESANLLKRCYDYIKQRFDILEIKFKDLYQTVQDYYDGFSPIGHGKTRKNFLFKKFKPRLTSGEQILAPTDLRQGNISDYKGIPVGFDIYGESPMFIDYTDNHLNPSTFIFASSGSGKTTLVQSILTQMALFNDTYIPIIIDWKNEYVDLARVMGMQIISASPVDGLYFSTIEIPATTGDSKIDEQNKENALRTTENIFEILLGEKVWNTKGVPAAIDSIRNSLYLRHGVYLDDPDTWKNSKGLTFHTFYAEIDRILKYEKKQVSELINDDSNGKVLTLIKQTLDPYFKKNGSKNSFFKKAIRSEDILSSRGVVFALDRAQENGGSNEDTKLQLSMQFIMHIINILKNKKEDDKKLLMVFYEESNRLFQLPKFAEMISGLTTSGRSEGIRNFFITNAPSQVLDLGDKDRQNSKFTKVDPGVISSIVSNVGSVIIGANNNRDMQNIARSFNLLKENQLTILRLLAEQNNNSNSDDNALAHKFFILHREKTTLIEAITNETLMSLDIFGTQTKVKNDIDDEKKLEELLNSYDNQKYDNQAFNHKKEINNKIKNNKTSLFDDI